MKPYYSEQGIEIYCGDCREISSQLGHVDTVITDPVWPNAKADLFGKEDPAGMLYGFWSSLVEYPVRAAIHLGCDSDPAILSTMPSSLEFFRVCWLEMVRPHYKGRLMYGSDVAYLFGTPPKSKPGQRVIPGRFTDASANGKESDHPCPRKIGHVKWLVRWWSEETDIILDPFMGSGTTILAARTLGRKAIGIEINQSYCDMAVERLRQSVLYLQCGDHPGGPIDPWCEVEEGNKGHAFDEMWGLTKRG